MRLLVGILLLVAAPLAQTHAQSDADLFELIENDNIAGMMAALLDGADPNVRQEDGLEATPLMWATSRESPSFISLLLRAGADVNAVDTMGDPAINWAAYYGNLEAFVLLLGYGADTSLSGHGTAEDIVMRRGHQDLLHFLHAWEERLPERAEAEAALVEMLIADTPPADSQVDVASLRDFAGRPFLQEVARANAARSIEWLVAQGAEVDTPDAIGFTALFEAARDGQAEAVAALLAQGADVNHRARENALSLTALHMAATGNHPDIVGLLLEAGADPDVHGRMGATPLMWAVFEGSREAAAVLLEAGADASIATNDGTRFSDIARQRGWDDLAAQAEAD